MGAQEPGPSSHLDGARMSDTSQGPGWWLASDGKWYPPQSASTPLPPPAAPGAPTPPTPVWSPAPGPGMPLPPSAPYAGAPPGRGMNGFAIAALVLGILWLCAVGSVLAIVFGFVALSQIKSRQQSGKGLAIAGIVLGILGILATIATVIAVRTAADEIIDNQPGEADDVSIADCTIDPDGHGRAVLEITNDSSRRSSYLITVEFGSARDSDAGGIGVATVGDVDPGQTVSRDVVSSGTIDGVVAVCDTTIVERFASD